jgi:hypothetical protein
MEDQVMSASLSDDCLNWAKQFTGINIGGGDSAGAAAGPGMMLSADQVSNAATTGAAAGAQMVKSAASSASYALRKGAINASGNSSNLDDTLTQAGASAQANGNAVASMFYQGADMNQRMHADGSPAPVAWGLNKLGDAAGSIGDGLNTALSSAGDLAAARGSGLDHMLTGAADSVENLGSTVSQGLTSAGQTVSNLAQGAGDLWDQAKQYLGGGDSDSATNVMGSGDASGAAGASAGAGEEASSMPGGMIVGGPDDPGAGGGTGGNMSGSDGGDAGGAAPSDPTGGC